MGKYAGSIGANGNTSQFVYFVLDSDCLIVVVIGLPTVRNYRFPVFIHEKVESTQTASK